ncbi:hypothetical protein AVEN_238942-1 [Araneus ventricosus]|uniref:Uncharacterized protein n=1 Tax=Araneus ventricosus TaxID=182803 RepID=A0A4Y2GS96_ARAVE|nr:hypothetical protein AVEN_238942-1 [Araneus ventricosus]
MDGPFVNWKFYELLQNDLKIQHNFQILCIGSCGLHILNNSFKHGEKVANWNINSILSSLYWLFKDAPVEREDLMKLTSSEKFPLKFCCHRWLENVPCVERAIEIWTDIFDKSLIPSKDGDEILLHFKEFLDKIVKCSFSDFKTLDHKEQRLDTFLYQYFSVDKEKYKKLCDIVKMILILSYGQATMERGFSLKKALEVENLKENHIAQRMIIEAIKEAGDVFDVPIIKEMRISVQCARQQYLDYLECQKREKMEDQLNNKRKLLVEEIDFLQAKRKCLEEDVKNTHQFSDALADEGEKEKRHFTLFLKSNAIRKEVTEKSFELKSIEHKSIYF